jgi:hypothetical protein
MGVFMAVWFYTKSDGGQVAIVRRGGVSRWGDWEGSFKKGFYFLGGLVNSVWVTPANRF